MDNQQIFLGKFDHLPNFVIDGNQHICSDDVMVTESITIQNGEVVDSLCKNLDYTYAASTTTSTIVSTTTAQLNEFCIRLHSGEAACPSGSHGSSWEGDSIAIYHNGVFEAGTQYGFTNFEYCLPLDQVDVENDIFEFENGGDDGVSNLYFPSPLSAFDSAIRLIKVCLESIIMNDQEIFLGKTYFVIDGDQQICSYDSMVTESIQIQNGLIIDSLCMRRPEIETTTSSKCSFSIFNRSNVA